jgi:hypothetical protein
MLLVLLFCGLVIVYSMILQARRLRNFRELHINNKRILGIYNNKKTIEIDWEKVDQVFVEVSHRKKTVKINSKGPEIVISIDSRVKNFDLLMKLIGKYTNTS